MGTNDRVLINGIIDDRLSKLLPSGQRNEVFELFCFEQLLKSADLSPDDIQVGWVDGSRDGGIDGFFVFVNGHLLDDPAMLHGLRWNADVLVLLVTCKHQDTFKQVVLDQLIATMTELFDFRRPTAELSGAYSQELRAARDRLFAAYRALATRISSFSIRVVYASRGDTQGIGETILARARQIEALLSGYFGGSEPRFQFVGSAELLALSRRARSYSLELPFLECFSHGDRYVLLTQLQDYARFVLDEDGDIRRYLFESNVRDFVGLNRVNEDIATTLAAETGPDFWWLNNGITMLVTKAVITGKAIAVEDVQIVNGLQTTESIARHFRGTRTTSDSRAVLVKVLKTDDPAIRDAIIRATNNQTAVEQQSLHATDKVQRDIEEVLLRSDWYYDRRQNYYANQGRPLQRIVSPLYVASAAVGLLLKSPSRASALKQRHIARSAAYRKIFSESVDLAAWPVLVSVLKAVDAELVSVRAIAANVGDRFLKRWRYLVALLVVARIFGRFSFGSRELGGMDLQRVTGAEVQAAWSLIQQTSSPAALGKKRALTAAFVKKVCEAAACRAGDESSFRSCRKAR